MLIKIIQKFPSTNFILLQLPKFLTDQNEATRVEFSMKFCVRGRLAKFLPFPSDHPNFHVNSVVIHEILSSMISDWANYLCSKHSEKPGTNQNPWILEIPQLIFAFGCFHILMIQFFILSTWIDLSH